MAWGDDRAILALAAICGMFFVVALLLPLSGGRCGDDIGREEFDGIWSSDVAHGIRLGRPYGSPGLNNFERKPGGGLPDAVRVWDGGANLKMYGSPDLSAA